MSFVFLQNCYYKKKCISGMEGRRKLEFGGNRFRLVKIFCEKTEQKNRPKCPFKMLDMRIIVKNSSFLTYNFVLLTLF